MLTLKAKRKNTAIECIVNEDLAICLDKCVEVMGHDDSLPFNAEVFVYDKDDETGYYHKIATAWNDGWGGDSTIQPTMQKYAAQLKKIDDYLKNNFEIVTIIEHGKRELKWDLDLEYLIDVMAGYCIDGRVFRLDITELDGYRKKNIIVKEE